MIARRNRRTSGCAALACVLAACGCVGDGAKGKKSFVDRMSESVRSQITSTYHDPEADAKMARADEEFNRGDYKAAQDTYADLADNTYNTASLLEKARWMEAESVRMQGRLPRAVDTYNRLLKDFPAGLYTEKAAVRMYAIADGWLKEQVKDIEDEQAGRNWAHRYTPGNPFDRSKPFMDRQGETLKTLDNICSHAPMSSVADKAMFWCGYIHYARADYDEADHYFSLLCNGYKDSPLKQEAAKYAVASKNRATGGPAYDGQKSAEALQLVHNLEATEPQYIQDKEKNGWLQRQKLAIRLQQAEKDYGTAEYYRRINVPQSAYFYYEMVRRRYPGTKFSDLATSRMAEMEQIRKQREADKAAGKQSTWDDIKEVWEGKTANPSNKDPVPGRELPARPLDAPTHALPPPPGMENQR